MDKKWRHQIWPVKKLAEIFYMKEKKHFFWLLQEMEEMNAILKRMNKAKTDKISNKELIRKKIKLTKKNGKEENEKTVTLGGDGGSVLCFVTKQNTLHIVLRANKWGVAAKDSNTNKKCTSKNYSWCLCECVCVSVCFDYSSIGVCVFSLFSVRIGSLFFFFQILMSMCYLALSSMYDRGAMQITIAFFRRRKLAHEMRWWARC